MRSRREVRWTALPSPSPSALGWPANAQDGGGRKKKKNEKVEGWREFEWLNKEGCGGFLYCGR